MNEEKKQHRIFFALWPPDETRQYIVDAFMQTPQYRMRGRIMDPANLHITLHFIGNVDSERRACLHRAAQSVKVEACRLKLDYYGHFYRARVFWIGCRETPRQLKYLHRDLGATLKSCDYRTERRPYAPHLTLMRKLNRPGEMIRPEPIEWPIDEFVMVESTTLAEGVRYDVVERYRSKG